MNGKKSDIIIILPDKEYNLKIVNEKLFLDKIEYDITYPKSNNKEKAYNLIMRDIAGYKLAIQFECEWSRKLSWYREGKTSPDLKEKIEKIRGYNFVNLHHHDDYSVRDGLGTVGQLVDLLQARNHKFCCVSNHGSVGGWITQYITCKKNNIKPIFSMEAYVNNYRGKDPELMKQNRSNYHLNLIVRTEEGYRNLIKVHNDAQLNGFYYKPRCDHENLKKYGKGIIGLSSCLAGEINSLLQDGNKEEAKRIYEFYKEAFDDFYLEMTMIDMDEQVEANKKLIEFVKEVNGKLVVTLDSHYLYSEYNQTHEILLLIKSRKTLNDKAEKPEEVWQFSAKDLFYRSEEQLRELWNKKYKSEIFTEDILNEAILNTRRICLQCEHVKIESPYKLPKLYENANEELRKHTIEGLKNRGLDKNEEYVKRIEYELDIIIKMGLSDYFLIVEKIVKDAIEKFGELATGFGRGSAAGSCVSYCLKITDIDPIEHNLLFERFLEISRNDMPDIDLDFRPDVRDWVKQHIVELFGESNTCSIGTYQRYKTKAVIIDVARTFNLDVWEAMGVTKKLESRISIEEDGVEEDHFIDTLEFEELYEHFPELKAYFEKYPDVLRHAKILRNQVKNMGKHAGGMIISNLNLQDYIPVIRDKDGEIIAAWSEGQATHELSYVGLVKFDILGLCLEENTLIKTNKGNIPIKFVDDFLIEYLDNNNKPKYTKDFLLIETGEKDLIEIILENGEIIKCTKEHKFFIF